MRIAFVGKGGSGKTTVSALLIQRLAAAGQSVMAIDADIDQRLGAALGMPDEEVCAIPPMVQHLDVIKDYLRGSSPLVPATETTIKTTPAGRGSHLLCLNEGNIVHNLCATRLDGELASVRLMVTGSFNESDLGVSCYHSKTGAADLYLNYLVDDQREYVVMDMAAGSHAFASGLFTRFDLTCLVVEPTRKSLSVYKQYIDYAHESDVTIRVVGNKIALVDDVSFLRDHTGTDLIEWRGTSSYVRVQEQGRDADFAQLESANRAALARLHLELDAIKKDWAKFTRQGAQFHVKNALAWGNKATGLDLTAQMDPYFITGPEAFVAS